MKLSPFFFLVILSAFTWPAQEAYKIGVGIADITGPAAEINMMGYAKSNQDTAGIHMRLYARAFIIADDSGNRICYVNTDLAMVSQAIKLEVTRRLQIYGDLYTRDNVMLAATHTHSGPGGFLQYVLYIITSQGFIWQNFEAIVSGIVKSVERAHATLKDGKILYNEGELLDASINRSPASYIANPESEIKRYEFDTDKTMQILKFVNTEDKPIGMINWFAVHPTSMNNTNRLISGDNKGYAELLFEREINDDSLPGRGPFVAAFSNANLGDVSPNTKGPRCIDSGLPCDIETSSCDSSQRNDAFGRRANDSWRHFSFRVPLFNNRPDSPSEERVNIAPRVVQQGPEEPMISDGLNSRDKYIVEGNQSETEISQPVSSNHQQNNTRVHHGNDKCIAFGPGSDMFDSTKIIGEKQYTKARELFDTAKRMIEGPVSYVHQHVDMSDVTVVLSNNQTAKTCKPAMGLSFAAGTIDGCGAFNLHQGATKSTPFWNFVRDFIKKPSDELVNCQKPKPILLATGEMKFPYLWQPSIMPTQIFRIGSIVIVGLPAEFTTMSGRRVREAVADEFKKEGIRDVVVILAGLANAYSSYVATFEEYQKQRYEAASTIYGPHTLQAYIQQYRMLAHHLATNKAKQVPPGPDPPNMLSKQLSFKPGVIMDTTWFDRRFGDVIRDVRPKYMKGETVVASFVAANPRNNLQTERTFLTVEKFDSSKNDWQLVASDSNWETKFFWRRTNRILGESEAIVTWDIPDDVEPGSYRIQHYGVSRNLFQVLTPYKGTSSIFKVES